METSTQLTAQAREHLRERQARLESERRQELERKVAIGIGGAVALVVAYMVNASCLQTYCENMYLL